MKWLPLLWAALRRRPLRSIFTLLSIAIAFQLVGIMSGVNARFDQIIEEARIDRIGVTARFGVWFPLVALDRIVEIEGVTHVAPQATMEATFGEPPDNAVFPMMTDGRMADIRPEMAISPAQYERLAAVRDGLIVSQPVADRFGWEAGDTFPLQTDRLTHDGSRTWTFTIVEVVPPGEWENFTVGNFVYLNEGRADGRYNDIHYIGVLVDDPERAAVIANEIESVSANSQAAVIATPDRAMLETAFQSTLDLEFLAYAISGAALFMILFLAGNVMAQSVRERIPEFAVMKAIGFSDRSIFALVLAEAGALCLIGAAIGLAIARATPTLVGFIMPNSPEPAITLGVIVFAMAAAVFVAAASGLPAAWRVRRLTVAEALGGR